MKVYYILIIVLLLLLGIILLTEYNEIEKRSLYTSFVIADKIGFDLNKTALTFGQINKGGGANRGINISNDNPYDVKVIIKVEGEISEYISVSDNEFYLEPGEIKKLDFYVSVPEEIEKGKYDGSINIIFKRF